MWTAKNRKRYDRSQLRYPSDLTDDEWQLIEPLIPPAKRGGRQARGERPGSHEWGHVCAEHRLPMAGDPEGFAATSERLSLTINVRSEHSVRLYGFMELRGYAGAHPSRALCKMPRAGRT